MKLSNYFGRLLLLAMISGIAVGNLWGQNARPIIDILKTNWQNPMESHVTHGNEMILSVNSCGEMVILLDFVAYIEEFQENFEYPELIVKYGYSTAQLNMPAPKFNYDYSWNIDIASLRFTSQNTNLPPNLYKTTLPIIIDASSICFEEEVHNLFFYSKLETSNGVPFPIERYNGKGNFFDTDYFTSSIQFQEHKKYHCLPCAQNGRNADVSKLTTQDYDQLQNKLTKRGFQVYPNPANNIATLDLKNTELIKEIELVSANGKILKKFPMNVELEALNIDVSALSNGVYFVKILNNMTLKPIKLIVKH